MSAETKLSIDEKVVTDFSQKRAEPEWIANERLQAYRQLSTLPLPKLQKTNIESWNFTRFNLGPEQPLQRNIPEHARKYIQDEVAGNFIIQENADVLKLQLNKEWQEKGVIFTDLATAVKEHESLVRPYLENQVLDHRLDALNASLWSGGAFLYIPKNLELKVPLQGLFLISDVETAVFPRILIIAEENSRVEFVSSFVSLDNKGALNNARLEVYVGSQAQVRVATVNHLPESAVDVTYRHSTVDRDGKLEWIVGDFSDGRVISDNTISLKGFGSDVRVKSVTLGAGEMRANITANITHSNKHTTSDIQARSALKDSASSILNSITYIEKGASKSDGQQTGKVLMLNPRARGDANPILLIDENDVTAGHAASVGQIDPIQMYYLMSRGVAKEEAERLIIHGFLDSVVSQIPSESLRERIYGLIEEKFQI